MTTATFSREDILRVGMEEELREELREELEEELREKFEEEQKIEKRRMVIRLYKQHVDEKVILLATGVDSEELREWLKEEGLV